MKLSTFINDVGRDSFLRHVERLKLATGHTSYNSSPNYFPANVSVECVDDIEKQRYYQQNARMHRCCCGLIHSVGGTKLFLFFYTTIMAAGLAFGMASTFVWTGIPIVIVAMSIYALIREKHKYLYPFLIISGVHVLVCLLMALIIIAFTAANYPTLRQVIGHSISNPPTDAFIVAVVSASVGGFLLLAVMHVWQITVIYRCALLIFNCNFKECSIFNWEAQFRFADKRFL
ncbi:unnamed protein product [Toxocara canis]|uniref:Uncharacterized protein n=1 Tax=Toxocara canis TaxID=6265 RepID=A0A183TY25_TOXCA|nr:unnamed protein product [Toxocara canis]